MSVAMVIEVIASSDKSPADAVAQGVARATDSLDDGVGASVKDQQVAVSNGKVTDNRVHLMASFALEKA